MKKREKERLKDAIIALEDARAELGLIVRDSNLNDSRLIMSIRDSLGEYQQELYGILDKVEG